MSRYLPIACCLMSLLMCTVWGMSAQAGIIGQKRFLPINQHSEKQRAAIVVSAREASMPSHHSAMLPLSGGNFIPIKRQINTIQRNTQRASQYLTSSSAHPASHDAARIIASTMQAKAMASADGITTYSPTHKDKGDALLELYSGQDTIEASHPFLRD